MPRILSCLAAVLLTAATAGAAQAAGTHAHGVARLDVAVDGPVLTLQLASPLESLLGFERAPRNDAERAQVRALAQGLRSGSGFAPTAAARCALAEVRLRSPVLAPELLGEKGPAAAADDDHAELEAAFVYRCADAQALRGVDVLLFDQFKRLRRVDGQVAGPKGQSALQLTARARQIRW